MFLGMSYYHNFDYTVKIMNDSTFKKERHGVQHLICVKKNEECDLQNNPRFTKTVDGIKLNMLRLELLLRWIFSPSKGIILNYPVAAEPVSVPVFVRDPNLAGSEDG